MKGKFEDLNGLFNLSDFGAHIRWMNTNIPIPMWVYVETLFLQTERFYIIQQNAIDAYLEKNQ